MLPDHVPLAELLPTVLDYAGESAADDGERHGGWSLRRPDGKALNSTQSLAMQQIRDGEILHLAPRYADWPEGEYDDVVEAIADGAKVLGSPWQGRHTRRTGLTITAVTALLALAGVLATGPNWFLAGILTVAVGFGLLLIGLVLSRAAGDSMAGALIGALGLPYLFAGGYLVLGANLPLTGLGAPSLLVGSAALLLGGIIGFVGIADLLRVFTAAALIGFLGVAAALIGLTSLGTDGVAAIIMSVAVALLPMCPLLAIRLAKLPMPELPQTAKDLVKEGNPPPKDRVFSAVVQADELLTGLLTGASIVAAVSTVVLALTGTQPGEGLLIGTIACVFLLRARLFPAVRQRVPLLATGVLGLALLTAGLVWNLDSGLVLAVLLGGVLPLAAIVAAAGLVYARRAPTPYLGRIADITDIILIISMIPMACLVLGLFGLVHGLGG
ncbi:type VII secretion integral membrane protein EccD [Phytomonospora endophytica]|uniref:Type VII secretion integral membrane protein EccD n=1 Tax=Phytomonospora endophytica TaxID=714109 RepID=A0A841FG67_9ACTN|nr:type VII secretion integral membrane protein EccD [Phytomonospora endophytica]GIG65064.1 type VII secretion integral membrane protein EccD [Phytomonospora endophytica]